VALKYLQIIKQLGVECGLHKSVLSPKGIGLEFAKKTFYKGINISPTPLAELSAALSSPTAMIPFMKKYNLSLLTGAKVAGFGYKVLAGFSQP
jgi:hypothetical protein